MKKVIILSKDHCQGCNSLKLFLTAALRNKYDDKIEHIRLEERPEEYHEWAEKVQTTQVPTLILLEEGKVEEVVRGFNPPQVKSLFEDNFQETTLKTVIKRDGEEVAFDRNKVITALEKAGKETGEYGKDIAIRLADTTIKALGQVDKVNVEDIQDKAEEVLLASGLTKTARAYIIYREARRKDRARNLFKKRLEFKPYEYPELEEYVEAIQHSYWIHTEFNYTSDIQDFKVNVSEAERNAIKNAMLAISQVEVAVKTFWGDIYKHIPKPEIGSVGAVFSESEVRHSKAYSHLLEILGLNDEFNNIKNIPELMQRVEYLDNSVATAQSLDPREYVLAVILFSLFIEHVSLFSQFLVIMSFNKHQNLFKGISNVIEATSKEEELHGQFGIDLVNTIREENPEWFDDEMEQKIVQACLESYKSEEVVIDWIYEKGDLEFMPKHDVKEFVKHRLNNSLESVGYDRIFDEDEEAIDRTQWFDDEILSTKHVDFFVKRSINYTKKSRSITSDDLF